MSLRKRGNFLNLLQNEGVPRKYPENPPFSEGGSLRKKGGGGVQPWKKLWSIIPRLLNSLDLPSYSSESRKRYTLRVFTVQNEKIILVAKNLGRETSHEPGTSENIFHVCCTFPLGEQMIYLGKGFV